MATLSPSQENLEETKSASMDSGDYLKAWLQLPSTTGDATSSSFPLAKALDPEKYVQAYWKNRTRPDGRMFSEARPTKVLTSLLKHSIGSALVEQGDTKVLTAMTIQIGQPSPTLPDHGDVVVSLTAPGPGSTHIQCPDEVLQSWLQRMLDDLLPSRLTLMTGKACIRLIVTVLILQDDGNLRDATLASCMAAWKDTTLPSMDDLREHQGKLWWDNSSTPRSSIDGKIGKSSLHEYRISLSIGVIDEGMKSSDSRNDGDSDPVPAFLVDPSLSEIPYCSGILTLVVTMPQRLLQMDYSGSTALSVENLTFASKMAMGRADELATLFGKD